MKYYVLFLSILFVHAGFSQVKFESGYYIDVAGTKHDGFIKNYGWIDNPDEIEFKPSLDVGSELIPLARLQEFEVLNKTLYKKVSVDVDVSVSPHNLIARQRAPIFEKKVLLLQQLVGGKADLYRYVDGSLRYFFYSKDDEEIKQLIYKKFQLTQGEIIYNESYKQLLFNEFNCKNRNLSDFKRLSYYSSYLSAFFTAYNECVSGTSVSYVKDKQKADFNLTIRPGLSFSDGFYEGNENTFGRVDFESQVNLRIGIEIEYVLPINSNKWSLLFEPTYRQIFNDTVEAETAPLNVDINYESIEFPIGARHYIFLNNNTKFFLNALFVIDAPINDSTIEPEFSTINEINSVINLALGGGIKVNNKFSGELRYYSSRNLLSNFISERANYNAGVTFILGYSIF